MSILKENDLGLGVFDGHREQGGCRTYRSRVPQQTHFEFGVQQCLFISSFPMTLCTIWSFLGG